MNAEDLDRLIERWRGPLVGLLGARGADRGQAIEIAQEVFAEAWMSRDRFRGDLEDERAVGAWLAGIARNLHRVATRSRGPRLVEVTEQTLPAGAEVQPEDNAARLREAVQALPDPEREVVQAFYLEQTSVRLVAGLLGVSERAVEGRLRRARQRLRQMLRSTLAAP